MQARAEAGRFEVASATESRVAQKLAQLSAHGYGLLNDRAWPGSRNAQVDLIVVGPAGLFIVDTKAWSELKIDGDRVFQGDDDVTERFEGLSHLADDTQQVFAEIGLAAGEVHAIAVMAGKRSLHHRVRGVDVVGEHDVVAHIARRGSRLPEHAVDAVLTHAISHFRSLDAPLTEIDVSVPEPVLPVTDEHPALIDDHELQDALLAGILAEPIEDWMAFLHPEQAKLVRRTFNGPSRIRGAAGTGKTVVGLHRAAHLARMNPTARVLVTTYVNSLPKVLSNLLRRMAPEVADRVDFMSGHQYASRLLRGRGVRLDIRDTDTVFADAWSATKPERLGDRSDYWRDELDHVIKARGVTTFEAYSALPRTGRKRPLGPEQRREVWNLYCEYDRRMRDAGRADWHDLATRALASATLNPDTTYSHVIVDEAQDLSCTMIRLLHAMVGDRPDGLTLIGDGRQTIYPGGFSLAEVGISLAGRGVVLSTNYRNTAQILEFAASQIAGLDVTDIEGVVDAAPTAVRSGTAPSLERFRTRRELDDGLVSRIRSAVAEVGTGLGDLAVLSLDWRGVRASERALTAAGIPWTKLDDYDGTVTDAVKVGTIKRAKGLEFKHVLLAGMPSVLLDGVVPAEPSRLERYELERRELYVAMTRARDGLWVGAL